MVWPLCFTFRQTTFSGVGILLLHYMIALEGFRVWVKGLGSLLVL
jgi:hypothetical protein